MEKLLLVVPGVIQIKMSYVSKTYCKEFQAFFMKWEKDVGIKIKP